MSEKKLMPCSTLTLFQSAGGHDHQAEWLHYRDPGDHQPGLSYQVLGCQEQLGGQEKYIERTVSSLKCDIDANVDADIDVDSFVAKDDCFCMSEVVNII